MPWPYIAIFVVLLIAAIGWGGIGYRRGGALKHPYGITLIILLVLMLVFVTELMQMHYCQLVTLPRP